MKKVTLKELAQILNMSISTVSRALSDHPDISDETKRKVKEASDLYHYTPNLRARYLRTKSSGLIALILPEYNMFFIPDLMKSISKVVSENDYSLLIFQSDDSYEKELDIIEYCNQLSVDGILLSIGNGFDHKDDLIEANKQGAPIVLLDKVWANETLSSVGIDGAAISKHAVNYLTKQGHKSIGGIFARSSQMITESRLNGFLGAFENEPSSKASVLMIEDIVDFNKSFDDFLQENPDMTAIFAITDELMIRCHSRLIGKGYHIPNDMSLVCISDGVLPYLLQPNVSHLFHSPTEVGKKAAEALFSLLKNKEMDVINLNLDCELVELSSVKKI